MKLKNILVIGLTSLTLASCNDFWMSNPRQATAKSSFSARKQKSTAHLMEYMHLSL